MAADGAGNTNWTSLLTPSGPQANRRLSHGVSFSVRASDLPNGLRMPSAGMRRLRAQTREPPWDRHSPEAPWWDQSGVAAPPSRSHPRGTGASLRSVMLHDLRSPAPSPSSIAAPRAAEPVASSSAFSPLSLAERTLCTNVVRRWATCWGRVVNGVSVAYCPTKP